MTEHQQTAQELLATGRPAEALIKGGLTEGERRQAVQATTQQAVAAATASQKPKSWIRRHLMKIIGGTLIAGSVGTCGTTILGSGAVVGTTYFAAEQAKDALPKAAETAVNRELEQRSEEISQFLDETKNTVSTLVTKILEFLDVLNDKVENWKPEDWRDTASAAISLYEGLKRDVVEFIGSGFEDYEPDKIAESVINLIESDPELANLWKEIWVQIAEFERVPEKLEALKDSITTFDDGDKMEAWEDFKEAFWAEVQDAALHPFQDRNP